MPRSTLTEQLTGGAKPPAEKTFAPLTLLQNSAFPCLRYSEGEVVGALPIFEDAGLPEVDIPDIGSVHLAGTSAPLGSVPKSKVDYALHPTKRRGGEEIVSASFMGSSFQRVTSMGISTKSNLIGGEVFGSLPRGMSMEQRQSSVVHSIRDCIKLLRGPGCAAVQPTDAPGRFLCHGYFKVEKDVFFRDRLDAPSLYAQQLRRTVLKGAVVVFITAGYSGKRFIFERCKELGVRSVVIDGPDSWSEQLVVDGLVEDFVALDFGVADTLFERLLETCRQIRARLGDLDGVLTFCELAVPLVARVAEHLGLPGNSPEAVDTARNKHAARACMESAGLPTPLNFLIKSDAQLADAAAHVGFPAVIKPISGAASIGVIRVNDVEQLKKSFARVMKDLKGAKVVAGALIEGEEGDEEDDGNAAAWMDLSIMMEEYLDGDEVDVDLAFSGYEPVYGSITDNWPTVEPYFNETGSNCPSMLSRAKQLEIMDLGVKAVQCMKFESGVFHAELKYTSRGARLIEVNARMGGGPVRDTNLLVWGVDLVEQQLLATCGIPCRPAIASKPINELAELTVNSTVTGTLEHTDFLDEFQDVEGLLYARPLVQAGAACTCVDDGLPTWIAEVMVTRTPVAKAVEWVREIESKLLPNVPITPKVA